MSFLFSKDFVIYYMSKLSVGKSRIWLSQFILHGVVAVL